MAGWNKDDPNPDLQKPEEDLTPAQEAKEMKEWADGAPARYPDGELRPE